MRSLLLLFLTICLTLAVSQPTVVTIPQNELLQGTIEVINNNQPFSLNYQYQMPAGNLTSPYFICFTSTINGWISFEYYASYTELYPTNSSFDYQGLPGFGIDMDTGIFSYDPVSDDRCIVVPQGRQGGTLNFQVLFAPVPANAPQITLHWFIEAQTTAAVLNPATLAPYKESLTLQVMQRKWYQVTSTVPNGEAQVFSPMIQVERCDPTPAGTFLSDLQLFATWLPATWNDLTPHTSYGPIGTCNSVQRSVSSSSGVVANIGCVSVNSGMIYSTGAGNSTRYFYVSPRYHLQYKRNITNWTVNLSLTVGSVPYEVHPEVFPVRDGDSVIAAVMPPPLSTYDSTNFTAYWISPFYTGYTGLSASQCFVNKYLADTQVTPTRSNFDRNLFRSFIYLEDLIRDLNSTSGSELIIIASDTTGLSFVYDSIAVAQRSATPPPAATTADVDRAYIIMGSVAGALFLVVVALIIALVVSKRKTYQEI